MTAVLHGISTQTVDQVLTAGAGWNAISGCSIASSAFTAGDVYLLLAMADQNGSNANGEVGFRVVHGTTPFEDSTEQWETVSTTTTRRHRYFWWHIWTAVTGEGLTVEHNTFGDTVRSDQIQLAWVRLSDLAAADRQFNERTTDDGLSTTYLDGASVTFSANGSDIWLLLHAAYLDPGATTTSCKSRGNLDSDAALWGEAINEGEDTTNNRYVMCFARALVPSNGSHTFKEQSATTSGTAHTRLHSKVAAIRLGGVFKDVSQAFTATPLAATATAWADAVQTLTHTKSVNGDVLILASNIQRPASSGWDFQQRLRVDSTDQPDTQTTDQYDGSVRVADPAVDYTGWSCFTIVNATANLDIAVDGNAAAAATNRTFLDRAIVAFSMELAAAAAPTPHMLFEHRRYRSPAVHSY